MKKLKYKTKKVKKKLNKDKLQKLFIKLSWELLEYKFAYYHPNLLHKSWKETHIIDDSEYDLLEERYKKLAKMLNLPCSVSDSVGFPMKSPSGEIVKYKMINKKGLK